jgi:hypothetical protein
MHGFTNGSRHSRQSARARFRHGQRMAAVRAITAARLYLSKSAPTQIAAAERCGSGVVYVRAAVTLLQSENATLINEVIAGRVPILFAAKQMRRLAGLVAAYRTASATDRVQFAHAIGPTTLFDSSLVPAL